METISKPTAADEQEMWIAGENGSIFTRILVPRGMEKRPVVILSHAYNSSYKDLADYAEALAGRGFITVSFDFCGGSRRSRSEGNSLEMSLKTEVADLKTIIAAALAIEYADESRLFLYGESQGGMVSALAAAELGGKIAGEALLYPALCIPDHWGKFRDNPPEKVEFMGMELGRRFVEELPTGDIYDNIARFDGPVLIMHGDEDRVVGLSYSQKACERFKNAQLAVYRGEGHGFSPSARAAALARLENFLSENS